MHKAFDTMRFTFEEVRLIAQSSDAIVLVDEAYIEFSRQHLIIL